MLHLSNDLPGSYLLLCQSGRSEMINGGVSRQSWRDRPRARISRQHLLQIHPSRSRLQRLRTGGRPRTEAPAGASSHRAPASPEITVDTLIW